MTIRDAIRGSGLGRLDAEVLLAHVLGKDRSWLMAHDADLMTRETEAEFLNAVERRKLREPVAYITGVKEFYGRSFAVTRATLIPRPATETLVSETLRFLKESVGRIVPADSGIVILSHALKSTKPVHIVDIGTGSGIIAVTLCREGWTGTMTAVDISDAALVVAKKNAEAHGVADQISFVHGDGAAFIATLKEPFLLVSNPPYIPSDENLEKGVREFEPHGALFGGELGLDVTTPLLRAARENPACTGVILEIRGDQAETVEQLLA